jgi:hypothetical protein
VYVAQHQIDDRTLGPVQHVADAGDDHLPHAGFRQRLRERRGEVLEHHDRDRAGILELMLEFGGGVERVGIDHREAGAQCAEHGDRVLQQVRQHDGDAIAALEPGALLQPGTEGARAAVELAVAHRGAHAVIGDPIGVAAAGILDQRLE